jgi:hypothetical protein
MVQRQIQDFSQLKEEKIALHQIWEDQHGLISLDESSAYVEYYRILARKGWLNFNENMSCVEFICPLSKQMILNRLHLHLSRPPKDNFQNLAEFFDACLVRFTPEFISESVLSLNRNGAINESKWQKEVYRIGMGLLGRSCEIGVEVSRGKVEIIADDSSDEEEKQEKQFEIPGKIDFYINSKRQWALELLVRGDLQSKDPSLNELESHIGRFTGQYKKLPRNEWLVVDFRPLKYKHSRSDVDPENPPKKYLANTWIVFYPEDGKSLFVVKYGTDQTRVGKLQVIPLS